MIPSAVQLDLPPPSAINVPKELGVGQDTLVVGSVARLVPQKAPEMFVRARGVIAERWPEACFVLVGGGPLTEMVERERSSVAIADRLLLLQNCHAEPSLMGQFDVFMLSSRYEAGAPFAPMEAMRTGTPVVLTDVVGSNDAVDHGLTGLVVPPEDSRALADAAVTLLSDATLREQMAESARRRLAERFDVNRVAGQLQQVYCRAARSR